MSRDFMTASLSLSLALMALCLDLNDAFTLSPLTASTRTINNNVLHHADPSADALPSSISSYLLDEVKKMNSIMTPEFFEASPVLKIMHSQCVKNFEIKESSIPGAGLGLFAKKNIKSGTIIAFYPTHALGVDGDSQSAFSYCPEDKEYFQLNPSASSSYLHCTDQPLFMRLSLITRLSEDLKDVPLYLDVNPEKDIVGAWVSQMINDGATVESNSERAVLDYYQASGSKRNCIHIPWSISPVMATVTTKKVKKGEEFFTSYGATYWLGVWLNIHGEEGVSITNGMKEKIQETATELLLSMRSVSNTYAKQAQAMEAEVAKLIQ